MAEEEPINWELISYILASEWRFKLLLELSSGTKTPSQLAESLRIQISYTSKTLKELATKKCCVCLTPKRRKYKIYKITKLGENVLKEIHELTNLEEKPNT